MLNLILTGSYKGHEILFCSIEGYWYLIGKSIGDAHLSKLMKTGKQRLHQNFPNLNAHNQKMTIKQSH